MKTVSLLATGLAAAVLAMPLPAAADDTLPPDQAGVADASGAKAPASAQTVRKMQDNVRKMQAQMDRLGTAASEAEVQGILVEHMQTLHENMMLGSSLGHPTTSGMTGSGTGHGAMAGGDLGYEAMVVRMQQMEERMDRMQSVVDRTAGPAAAK